MTLLSCFIVLVVILFYLGVCFSRSICLFAKRVLHLRWWTDWDASIMMGNNASTNTKFECKKVVLRRYSTKRTQSGDMYLAVNGSQTGLHSSRWGVLIRWSTKPARNFEANSSLCSCSIASLSRGTGTGDATRQAFKLRGVDSEAHRARSRIHTTVFDECIV